jgi:hypothetical protein
VCPRYSGYFEDYFSLRCKGILTNLTSGTLDETEKGIKQMDTSLEKKSGHLVEVNALYGLYFSFYWTCS